MARNVDSVCIDVDLEIRRMLIEKKTVREIVKTLRTSERRVCAIRKALLAGEPIRKRRDDCVVEKRNINNRSTNVNNASNPSNPDETTVEATRKRVELRALEVLEKELADPDCGAKVAIQALGVVGTKPKAESGDLTVIIQSINNFGSEARKRMIERMAGEKQETVIGVTPEVLSDQAPAETSAPENPHKDDAAPQ